MRNKKWLMTATATLLVVLCLLAGCQTTVPVRYTEPARLNLSGVNRLAIDLVLGGSNDFTVAGKVADALSQRITETGKYTVAPAEELSAWKHWRELAGRQAQAIEVSAADLVGAYTGNAVRADASYGGKTLKITAVVNEIGRSSRGNYFARLAGAGNDSVDVYFASFEMDRLATVDKGQTITIIGDCFGFNPPDMEDTAEILRLLGAGRAITISDAAFSVDDYPGPVVAVIELKTASTIKDGPQEGDPEWHERSVTVKIDYQVLRTRDGSLIGEGTKSAKSGQVVKDTKSLPAIAVFAEETYNKLAGEFMSELVPTERTISLALAKEADNKDAKKEMTPADNLVKAGNYADAAAAYGRVYAQYKNFAAGYNQAVLTELTAGVGAAIELMEALSKETGNSMAQDALKGMQSRNTANQSAAAQQSE
jgi:hypothetical protein